MSRIQDIGLRVVNAEAQQRFYRDVLGMRARPDGTLGYGEAEAGLRFETATTAYAPTKSDRYWKIALAVPNLDLAVAQLRRRDVAVSDPHQFHDVGYLAHFDDPEGFTIELIDHAFAGEREAGDYDPSRLGGGACLNLITLRTTDLARDRDVCERLGMRPLSIQPVEAHGFTLHFFAFTDDAPPNPDLRAIENRTWLYRRPYTVLELQHLPAADGAPRTPDAGEAGYAGTTLDLDGRAFRDGPLGLRSAADA